MMKSAFAVTYETLHSAVNCLYVFRLIPTIKDDDFPKHP